MKFDVKTISSLQIRDGRYKAASTPQVFWFENKKSQDAKSEDK